MRTRPGCRWCRSRSSATSSRGGNRATRSAGSWSALGFMFLLGSDGGSYATWSTARATTCHSPGAAAFFGAFWIWLVILGPLPIALFPDGHVSRRWGWVIRSYLVLGAGVVCFYTWQDIRGLTAQHVRIDNEGAFQRPTRKAPARTSLSRCSPSGWPRRQAGRQLPQREPRAAPTAQMAARRRRRLDRRPRRSATAASSSSSRSRSRWASASSSTGSTRSTG